MLEVLFFIKYRFIYYMNLLPIYVIVGRLFFGWKEPAEVKLFLN